MNRIAEAMTRNAPSLETSTQMLVEKLTTREKIALTAGASEWQTEAVARLGIRTVRMSDGPNGVRVPLPEDGALSMFTARPATCFPTPAAMGATWNPQLIKRVGEAIGTEARALGVDIVLGPGINLKRTPIGGRNFEYFSEDPLVSSTLGTAWIRGVQATGTGTSLKHFAVNGMERRRYGVDQIVDERALRELYLASFERVIADANPTTVMASYPKLGGVHCTENRWLLTNVLRDEWGYTGTVISDWGAGFDRALSIPAGTDLVMPGAENDDQHLARALRAGVVSMPELDAAAARVIDLARRTPALPTSPDFDAHHELAREAAAEATVLLRNEGGLLPLAASARVAVLGAFAEEPRIQGAGSSHVVPTRTDTLLDALGASGVDVSYRPGYDRHSNSDDQQMRKDAAAAAAAADVAVVVIGLPEAFETEAVDRTHLRLPDAHNALVESVLAANPRTVVVLQNGASVEMPWRDRVPAILETYLGGQAGGSATAAVILGELEPGGRLAETFPVRFEDHPAAHTPNGPCNIQYRESLYLGYRYFDSAHRAVAFPFGHGLSYTNFQWGPATLAPSKVDGGSGIDVVVTVPVTNVGDRRGSDVVQVYVHAPEGGAAFRPDQELRGFQKVTLDPGQTAHVSIRLDERAFRYWDDRDHGWRISPGQAEIRVGASSRDIRDTIDLTIDAPARTAPVPVAPVYQAPQRPDGFTAAAFRTLPGASTPGNTRPERAQYTLDTAICDMQGSAVARLLLRFMRHQVVKTLGVPTGHPLEAVADDVVGQLNLRMLPTVTAGALNRRSVLLLAWLIRHIPNLSRPSTSNPRSHQ